MLGLWSELGLGLPFAFTMLLPSLLHSPRVLSSRYNRCLNKDSSLKNHGRFGIHCLDLTIPILVSTTISLKLTTFRKIQIIVIRDLTDEPV